MCIRDRGQGVKGSALPELQAQYAKQGIEFDPNAMYEQMNYAIPGAKGSASGWRKVDPNRQQGSFSVVPGLSDADQQRYKEIVANETRQREYAPVSYTHLDVYKRQEKQFNLMVGAPVDYQTLENRRWNANLDTSIIPAGYSRKSSRRSWMDNA